jgi:hypothetical protein
MKLRITGFFLSVLIISTISVQAGNAVWWEGEDALKSDFVPSDWLAKPAKPTRLSGMKWLNCQVAADAEKKQKSYSAVYEINVPETSDYTFWVREFYRRSGSPWKYRFDNEPWIEVKKDHPATDIIDLGRDRSVVWCKYNKVNLPKGKHKFEIEISEKPKNKGFLSAFDCFLLTDVPFTPKGWHKPKVLAKYGYIGTYVWLEGEDAKSDFINNLPDIPKSSTMLSNSGWLICSTSPDKAPLGGFTAKWKFTIPSADSYHLWIREFTKKMESPFEYRFNNAKKWKTVTPSAASFDDVKINENSSACWVNYTKAYLSEGENTLEIRVSKSNKSDLIKLAIDCICLSLEPFTPAGKLKPDTKITPEKGWTTFRPKKNIDPASKNILSLRYLNEKRSGSHGFCKVDENGIFFKDGQRVRFWGINAYEPMKMDKDSVDAFVSQMADAGVNLIRIQGSLTTPGNKKFGTIDPNVLDKLCYFIKACKNNGVYVALALYSPKDYLLDSKSGFEGYKKPAPPYGMLYLNEQFRGIYKKWAMFLRKTNPYTNLKLCQDPTIAWFEIENGDGLFSQIFNSIPQQQKQLLENKYNKWLLKKHSGIQETLQAWSMPHRYHPVIDADGLRSGRPCYRFLNPETFRPEIIKRRATDFMNKRKMDQLQFLIKHCRKVNSELISFLRKDCKFKGLISIGNSSTAVPEILNPVLRYIQASGNIMARKGIFESEVLNDIKILTDNIFYQDKSALKNPLASPVITPSFPGKAMVTTAVSWPLPNKYRAEAVPFISVYSALHGSDTYLWYNADSPSWATRLKKYTIQDPATLGAFPGYALMFRRGDIRKGKILVHQQLGLPDIIALKGSNFSLDSVKNKLTLTDLPDFTGKVNPMAALAGRLEFVLDKEESLHLKQIDLSKYLNEKKGTVKSSTGQVKLDYKTGMLLINTPRSQGATGFFSPDIAKKLHDVVISFNNSYGTILVISLDGKYINKSKHLLIQFFTEESNYHWETSPITGKKFRRLDCVGDSPLIVKKASGSVSFPKMKSEGWDIWKLDINGIRMSRLSPQSEKYLKVELPSDSFHLELIKK